MQTSQVSAYVLRTLLLQMELLLQLELLLQWLSDLLDTRSCLMIAISIVNAL